MHRAARDWSVLLFSPSSSSSFVFFRFPYFATITDHLVLCVLFGRWSKVNWFISRWCRLIGLFAKNERIHVKMKKTVASIYTASSLTYATNTHSRTPAHQVSVWGKEEKKMQSLVNVQRLKPHTHTHFMFYPVHNCVCHSNVYSMFLFYTCNALPNCVRENIISNSRQLRRWWWRRHSHSPFIVRMAGTGAAAAVAAQQSVSISIQITYTHVSRILLLRYAFVVAFTAENRFRVTTNTQWHSKQ